MATIQARVSALGPLHERFERSPGSTIVPSVSTCGKQY
jgi:hypothetical protein